jgi:hypothetical protein
MVMHKHLAAPEMFKAFALHGCGRQPASAVEFASRNSYVMKGN